MRKTTITLIAVLLAACHVSLAQKLEVYDKVDILLDSANQLLAKYDFENAQLQVDSAFTILTTNAVSDNDLAKGYSRIGAFYLEKKDYHVALGYLLKAKSVLAADTDPEARSYLLKSLNKLALLYWERGDVELGLEYYLRAIDIGNREDPVLAPDYLEIYSWMVLNYLEQDMYDSALKYNQLCFDQMPFVALNKEHTEWIPYYEGLMYHSRALVYTESKEYEKADEDHHRAIDMMTPFIGAEGRPMIGIYSGLGLNAVKSNNREKAKYYYQRAIGITKKHVVTDDIYVSFAFNNIALMYFELGEFDEAGAYYDSALSANKKLQLGGNETHASPAAAFSSIQGIVKVLGQQPEENGYATSLRTTYTEFISQIDFAYDKTGEKLIEKYIKPVIDLFFEQFFDLYSTTGDTQYLNLLWDLAERNKSRKSALLASHKSNMTELVSYDLWRQEKMLKDSIVIGMEALSRNAKDTNYDSILFELNERYNQLMVDIQKEYPKYNELKYNTDIVNWSDVQNQLDVDQALIEFFVGDNDVYAFIVSREVFDIVKLPDRENLIEQTDQFLMTVQNAPENENVSVFTDLSHTLYNSHLKEVMNKLSEEVERITIVPDGYLHHVPFELLLTELPASGQSDYRSLAYLFRKYAVRYGYSSTSAFGNKYGSAESERQGILAFAPTYDAQYRGESVVRSPRVFSGLKWNIDEAKSLGSSMDAKVYLGKEASEARFKSEKSGYSVIHLAMHAEINDKKPAFSRLIFARDSTSAEDGFLNVYELNNMNIGADMVVLSACESGFGKYEYGEGVMSLGKAFTMAGCHSTVTSLWLVNDASTAKLMQYFYDNLAAGKPKDEALRQARLNFLETEPKLVSHPFYWGAFIVIGDETPIDLDGKNADRLIYIIILIAVLCIVGILIMRRFRRKA
ncbi:MAG: CHAT domain-containing protein [Bacteroidota bacterium]